MGKKKARGLSDVLSDLIIQITGGVVAGVILAFALPSVGLSVLSLFPASIDLGPYDFAANLIVYSLISFVFLCLFSWIMED